MESKPSSVLVRRLRDAEMRLRIFLALRTGLVASFYAFCFVMLVILMGVRVAGGEHTVMSYVVFQVTGLFAEEGTTIEALRTFDPPGLITMLAVGVGTAFVGGVLSRMLRPIPLNQVALYLDTKTSSREQFVTAYELAVSPASSPLDDYLVDRASRRIEKERLHRTPAFLPPRETWMQLIPVAVLAALMLLGPYDFVPRPKPQPQPLTRQEKDSLDKVIKAVDKLIDKEKNPENKKELEEIKKEFQKLKEEKPSQEKKVARVNKLMERLRQLQRKKFESAREKAAGELAKSKHTEKLADALRSGSDAKAEDALEKIGNQMETGNLSQTEQEQVLENLRRAQEAATDSPEMQEKLDRYLKRLSRMEKSDSLEELAKQRDLEQLARALKERNKEMYKKEIEKFMEKMEKGEMTEEDMEAMRQAIRQAAEKMGDERVKRGMERLEKSLDANRTDEQKAQELEKMLRQAGYGHKDEEMKQMAREFSEKLEKGELTKEDMKQAARALEEAAEKHDDSRLAEQAKNMQEKLEGPDTGQIEEDLDELMRLMEQSEECGGQGGEGDWQNAMGGAEELRREALGRDWGDSPESKGFEWGSGGTGGDDSERGHNPRPIRPGSGDPEVHGEEVDLLIKPELGVGQSAGRVYMGGKLYPRGKAKRPYMKVLGEMKESVLEKVEAENIPANYKKRVRDFFDTEE